MQQKRIVAIKNETDYDDYDDDEEEEEERQMKRWQRDIRVIEQYKLRDNNKIIK